MRHMHIGGRPARTDETRCLDPWFLFLASLLAMFAVAPFLQVYLGEFWSTASFLLPWTALYLLIPIVRDRTEARHDRE